jgi:hypothetical protein
MSDYSEPVSDAQPTLVAFGRTPPAATAKAARDAATLARALERAGRNVDSDLSRFEQMQIEFGQELVGVWRGARAAVGRLTGRVPMGEEGPHG